MTTETEFVAGPSLQEPLPAEAMPQRRRGRPPKVNANGERVAPKRRGRPPKRPRGNLTPQIQAFLTLTNMGVMMAQGKQPPPEGNGDALDAVEIELLAKSLNQQCEVSPRFRKYVQMALGVGSGGQLFTVALMIGARRMARHNIIPENFDTQIGVLLGSIEVSEQPPSDETENDNDAGAAAAA